MTYRLDISSVRFAEHIDEFEDVGAQFLRRVLELNWNECVLSTETRLSDFVGRAMPMELLPSTLEELYKAWDSWIIDRIKTAYGLELSTTSIRLVEVFRYLQNRLPAPVLH